MRLGLLGHPELVRSESADNETPPDRGSGAAAVRLQPRALAVLAYLHVEGPQERDHLAQLFWPNSAGGLNALSTTLSRIRQEAPTAIWTIGRAAVGCDLPSDYAELKAAAASGEFAVVRALSQRAFLQTLNLRRFGPEFEDWLLGVRSVLDADAEAALMRGAAQERDAGNAAAAADLAEAAFEIAERRGVPSIDLLPLYFEILAGAGRGLVVDVRAIAEEFSIELPEAGSVGVVERKSDAPPARSTPDPLAVIEASRSRPYFGCADELASLRRSIGDNPITTVVGLGGSGKTRLLTEYSAEQTGQFTTKLWVDVEGVSEVGLMAASIADTIGVPLRPGQPLASLFEPEVATLLVIDNSELVDDAGEVMLDLTAACPSLRVVLGRRLPLGIDHESIIAMTGLEIERDEGPSPAQQLFASAVQRAGAKAPTANDDADVGQICELVGGLPLALELAGAWAGTLSVGSIAQALESGIEVLDGSLPLQERSMESVLEFAWASLDPHEQRTVMALSVFVGGAPVSALAAMPNANMRTLGSLGRKALVTVTADDRFDLHALVRSVASRRLHDDPAQAADYHEAHARWYAELVRTGGLELDGPEQSAALKRLGAEVQNIWAAWQWSTEHGRSDIQRTMLASLREFMVKSARFAHAERFFELALSQSDSVSPGADGDAAESQGRLRAELTDALSWVSLVTGRTGRAIELSTRALKLAPDEDVVTASVLRTQAMIAFGQSDMAEAEALVTRALALLDPDVTSRLSAKLHEDLGHCHRFRGDVDLARKAYRSTLDNGRKLGDPHMVARSYLTLGELERSQAPQRARVLLEEGFAIVRENQLDHLGTYFPGALGKTWLVLGEYAHARDSFAEGVELASDAGVVITVAANHLGLAQAHHHLGESTDALREVELGLRRSVEGDCWPYLLEGLVTTSMIALESASVPDSVADLVRVAMHHPATEPETRALAGDLADRLGLAEHPPPDVAQVRLDELAEDALAVLLATNID